ncbi:MAG: hypothetical protein HLX50_09180 [Alteromonadaceae bacterium]|nr:hypothetical protein [Alteromonadaceae bacterium]
MNKKGIRLACLALTFGLMGSLPAHAEQLTVPVGTQADRSQMQLPASGKSQADVRQQWGTPQETRGPVGQPPISQWHYADFIVYFEGDRVLHTVVKRKP